MKINKLAIPLMLNSVSSTIISLCDQAMVGRTYLEGFASVGIIGSNIYSITGVLGAIAIGFNILGSKSKGREDYKDLNNSLLFSISLSIIIGFLFFIGCILWGDYILKEYFNVSEKALKDALMYLNIFSLSLGINLILFSLSSFFKIMNITKYIFYGNIMSCIANLLFDHVLIFGKFGFPKLGIVGNAIGSVSALLICLMFYIYIIIKQKLITKTKINILRNGKEIIKVSMPMIFQELVESTIVVFMMNYILSQIGMLEVSIYNLLFSIINIALMPMYAYSQAALNVISEDIGLGNNLNSKITIKTCINRALVFYLLISILIVLFKQSIPTIITNNEELILNSSKYIFIIVIANSFNVPSNVLKSSMQALGEEKIVFVYSSLISILSVIMIYLFVCKLNYGLYSVYLWLTINYLVLTLVLMNQFMKLKSKNILVKP